MYPPQRRLQPAVLQPPRRSSTCGAARSSAFLKAYYNPFAGLADRETYTFWEHYFHASPHKTHEEAGS